MEIHRTNIGTENHTIDDGQVWKGAISSMLTKRAVLRFKFPTG